MFPLLQLGPYALQVPGVILVVSLWLSLNVAEKEAKRQNFRADFIYSLVFLALVVGIVGARLWYVSRYLSAYLTDPLEVAAPMQMKGNSFQANVVEDRHHAA